MPQATKWNKDKPHPGFETYQDGFEGIEGLGKYERVAPDNFQGPNSGDDQFMHSTIMKYSREEATKDGKPTGDFVLTKSHAKELATEVIGTHMGLKGKEADDYLKANFDETWNYYDTADHGKIEAQRMSPFMRHLCKNKYIDI